MYRERKRHPIITIIIRTNGEGGREPKNRPKTCNGIEWHTWRNGISTAVDNATEQLLLTIRHAKDPKLYEMWRSKEVCRLGAPRRWHTGVTAPSRVYARAPIKTGQGQYDKLKLAISKHTKHKNKSSFKKGFEISNYSNPLLYGRSTVLTIFWRRHEIVWLNASHITAALFCVSLQCSLPSKVVSFATFRASPAHDMSAIGVASLPSWKYSGGSECFDSLYCWVLCVLMALLADVLLPNLSMALIDTLLWGLQWGLRYAIVAATNWCQTILSGSESCVCMHHRANKTDEAGWLCQVTAGPKSVTYAGTVRLVQLITEQHRACVSSVVEHMGSGNAQIKIRSPREGEREQSLMQEQRASDSCYVKRHNSKMQLNVSDSVCSSHMINAGAIARACAMITPHIRLHAARCNSQNVQRLIVANLQLSIKTW